LLVVFKLSTIHETIYKGGLVSSTKHSFTSIQFTDKDYIP
jgi:hypothetical protein